MRKATLETAAEWIERAEHALELKELRGRLRLELPRAAAPSSETIRWNLAINGMHDRIVRKVIVLAEQMVREEGFGAPPVPYSLVLFGSGGREEQTLWSDQDNGLIYEDPPTGKEDDYALYFQRLAKIIVMGLEEAGYPPCDGEVMASNPQWRQPVSGWKKMIQGWEENPSWESIRYLLIVSDIRPVYGITGFTEEIRSHILIEARRNPYLRERMLQNTLHRKIGMSPFGRLITERYGEDSGGFDVKYGAYIPFVNGVRMLAIRYGVGETSTWKRLEGLARKGILAPEQAGPWMKRFASLLALRSSSGCREDKGILQSTGILPADVLASNRKELRAALSAGQDLHRHVKRTIQRDWRSNKRGPTAGEGEYP